MTVTVTIIINKLYREDRYNKWNYICTILDTVIGGLIMGGCPEKVGV